MAGAEQPVTVNRLLRACYTALLSAGVFSFAVNMLMLTLPVFMFQVFDRVLASRSEVTLFLLLFIGGFALGIQAILDAIRAYAFVRVSGWIDRRVGPMLLSSIIVEALDRGSQPNSNPLRALSTLRTFLTGPGMLTMLDLPWVPVFLVLILSINAPMGYAAIIGSVLMFALGMINDRVTRPALNAAQEYSSKAYQAAESAVRNAAVVESMGMRHNILARWHRENEMVLTLQGKASDRAAIFNAVSKSARMMLQMVIMSVAVLQILDPHAGMTPGMMIACSLILGRALQPVEMGISQARHFVEAMTAYRTVEKTLKFAQSRVRRMELPPPTGHLVVENVGYQPRSAPKPILQRISFEVKPGEAVGVVGPSAAGKSTLARLLVGVEKPSVGNVRLDGADVFTWDAEKLGKFIGYMPQDTELFAGTVAENIARLDAEPDPELVIRAAKLAGLHDLILQLPDGYDTQIGNAGAILSGGQRQRVALARALYGDPAFVVLDEPNSNLDSSGDDALAKAIQALKARGATVLLITHRIQTLGSMDKILVLQGGMVNKFGNRDDVLASAGLHAGRMAQPAAAPDRPAGQPDRPGQPPGGAERRAAPRPAMPGGDPVRTSVGSPDLMNRRAGDATGQAAFRIATMKQAVPVSEAGRPQPAPPAARTGQPMRPAAAQAEAPQPPRTPGDAPSRVVDMSRRPAVRLQPPPPGGGEIRPVGGTSSPATAAAAAAAATPRPAQGGVVRPTVALNIEDIQSISAVPKAKQ